MRHRHAQRGCVPGRCAAYHAAWCDARSVVHDTRIAAIRRHLHPRIHSHVFRRTGTLQTATANTPRWDYNPSTHALNGLLIEEARTNLLLNSATLGTQSVTTTAVATTLSFYGTGTVTLSGTSTGSLVGTGAANRVALTFTPTAGTLTCTVTGSVTNAQVEAGAFATSYIPTTAASVTRQYDVAQMLTTGWYNTVASSLSGECIIQQSPNPSATLARDICCISDNNTTNRLILRGQTTASASALLGTSIAGTTTFSGALGNVSANGVSKMCGAWNGTTANGSLNGAAPVSYAVGMPGSITTLTIGNGTAGSGLWINGWMRRVRYWPRALSNAELQSVTT